MWWIKQDMWWVAQDMWWIAQDMWWVAQDMWWVAQDMWWEGCAGYVVVPRTFYSHFVVQLARLQDFKQS